MTDVDSSTGTLVAVEGPNGAGKSLVADHIARTCAATLVRYPASFVDFRARHRLDEAIAPLPRLAYYLAGIAHMSEGIARATPRVVCDRYFASPLALLVAEGAVEWDELTSIAAPVLARIRLPQLTVLLHAEHEVLKHRITARGEARPGASLRQTVGSEAFTARWLDALRVTIADRGPFVEIDTSELGPAEVCSRALQALPSGFCGR